MAEQLFEQYATGDVYDIINSSYELELPISVMYGIQSKAQIEDVSNRAWWYYHNWAGTYPGGKAYIWTGGAWQEWHPNSDRTFKTFGEPILAPGGGGGPAPLYVALGDI